MSKKIKSYKNSSSVIVSIEGMHCGNCVHNVEQKYSKTDGVYSVVVNLSSSSAVISYDTSKLNQTDIVHVLDDTQFSAAIMKDSFEVFSEKNQQKHANKLKNQLIKLIFSAVITVALVLLCHIDWPGDIFIRNVIMLILVLPVQFWCGWDFIYGAYKSLKNGMANMDVLVTVGTLIAFFYSLYITFVSPEVNFGMPFYDTCAMLITFISFGEYMEERAKVQTNKAVDQLVDLMPKQALKKNGDEWISVPVSSLLPGDIVKIDKNNPISCDGVVVEGTSKVDESMLTGESELQSKEKGDKVTAATFNYDNKIIVKVTHNRANSTLAKIIKAVSDAQSSKAPIQGIADKISSIFVPTVLLISVVTFVAWLIFYDGDWNSKFQQALICACSITVVACPCALVLATPTALTVAMGRGAQIGIIIKNAIVLETLCKIKNFVFDKTGTLTMSNLDDNKTNAKIIRPDASNTIEALKTNYDAKIYMISGDVTSEAMRIANKIGVPKENVVFEANPLSKKDYLQNLIDKENKNNDKKALFAYTGDGINDAPSLSLADVGICLEQSSSIALETGDVVLMHNKLFDLVKAIDLSRATMTKIKQNMFWALIYNVIFIPIAALGFVMPAWCGAIHAASSLLVLGNSLLLKKFK